MTPSPEPLLGGAGASRPTLERMTAEERDASILASVAAGRAVLILPDGTDPMLGSLEVALRLLGAGRPDAPEVIVLSALPGDPA